MRPIRTVILTLSMLAALCVSAAAETPNLVHYQGSLTDSIGVAVSDNNYAVTFRVFDQSAGGVELWIEATNQTTVNGLFDHLLGSVTPLPEDLFTAQDSLFMELTVEGETITPRITLGGGHAGKMTFIMDMFFKLFQRHQLVVVFKHVVWPHGRELNFHFFHNRFAIDQKNVCGRKRCSSKAADHYLAGFTLQVQR